MTAPTDLMGRCLLSARVFVRERPIEGGDVDTAASFAHQTEPRLVDGRVSDAGIKLQTFRDALHQKDPAGAKRRNISVKDEYLYSRCLLRRISMSVLCPCMCRCLLTCRGLSRTRPGTGGGCCSGWDVWRTLSKPGGCRGLWLQGAEKPQLPEPPCSGSTGTEEEGVLSHILVFGMKTFGALN